jgi:hypothetical protein
MTDMAEVERLPESSENGLSMSWMLSRSAVRTIIITVEWLYLKLSYFSRIHPVHT